MLAEEKSQSQNDLTLLVLNMPYEVDKSNSNCYFKFSEFLLQDLRDQSYQILLIKTNLTIQ